MAEERRTGDLKVSVPGFGCNQFGTFLDEAASMGVVRSALEQDVTFLDTADEYGDGDSERLLGRASLRSSYSV